MERHLIILPDGTELFSGSSRENAVISVEMTQTVNDGTELTLGSVCSSCIKVKLFAPDGELTISAGTEIAYYKVQEDESRVKVGIFTLETPTRTGSGTYQFTAYDAVSKLDKDISEWFNALDGWPYTAAQLAQAVCRECGVGLVGNISAGVFPAEKFTAQNLTGRKLMKYIGEACGRFGRATADGDIELAWYTDRGGTIAPSGANSYKQGGLSYEDYTVEKIERVQIGATKDDVGVLYPDGTEALNTYKVTGNPLLSATSPNGLRPIAASLYNLLQSVEYTPCKVQIFDGRDFSAGDIIHITDLNGVIITSYVMTKITNSSGTTLECTGSVNRDSVTAVNDLTLGDVNRKILEVSANIDGLRVENRDTAGNLAKLEMTVDGIQTQVENNSEQISTIKQTADAIDIKIQDVIENGVDKVSTEFGLTIDGSCVDIHRAGEEMHNSLDETGMYVRRGDEIMLQANNEGVIATDVTVRNYLIVGDHARFENYSNGSDRKRTACFWI